MIFLGFHGVSQNLISPGTSVSSFAGFCALEFHARGAILLEARDKENPPSLKVPKSLI